MSRELIRDIKQVHNVKTDKEAIAIIRRTKRIWR